MKQKSQKALAFFENNGKHSRLNDIWKLTAMHYYTVSDEYLTLYALHKSYNDGICDETHLICELERLISQREKLMLLAENVRIDATKYTYLRNMSMFRQFMTDYLDYIKEKSESEEKPKFDIFNTQHIQSNRMKFLR